MKRTRMARAVTAACVSLFVVSAFLVGRSARAQGDAEGQRHAITAISVDPGRPVVAPDGTPINGYGGMATLADEHTTIFGPGKLPGHQGGDYLFFVAARTLANSISSGLVVLTGGAGPTPAGQWTLDFARGFGHYFPGNPAGQQNAQVFLSPVFHDLCPSFARAIDQDPTFDLNYADPGSVLVDPTNRRNQGSGRVLMIYEGTNRCIGIAGGLNGPNNFFATTGIATSIDNGVTWAAYAADAVPLPYQSTVGPNAPLGAFGSAVCIGSDCLTPRPTSYGRYAAIGPPTPISALITQLGSKNLPSNVGDSQPAAFIDDVRPDGADEGDLFVPDNRAGALPYLYVVNVYNPGKSELGNPQLPNVNFDLVVARAQLNGGTAPLQFQTWYNGAFTPTGLGPSGGAQTPLFSVKASSDPVAYGQCLDPTQSRLSPSLSYVAATRQYVLTFMCFSPSDPLSGEARDGGAFFYSTIDATRFDLSHQDQWSAPQEIGGSWSAFNTGGACVQDFNGWYPSFMSLGRKPGHLSTNGYVFYMAGCAGAVSQRQFSSRPFRITTN